MSYKDNLPYKISTYNGPRLVALQYQAIIENLEEIKALILSEKLDRERLNYLLDKNRDIFSNLMVSLDEDTDFNNKTKALYAYMTKQSENALIHKDQSLIDQIIPLLTSTMRAWEEVADRQMESDRDVSVGATYGKKDVNVYRSNNEWEG